MRFLIWACLCIGLASAAQAEDKQAILDFGGDAFRAGASVTFTTVGTDDLFMAGETVNAAADITGSPGERSSYQAASAATHMRSA